MSHSEPVSVRIRWKIVQWVVFDGESIPSVAARIERSVTVVYRYVNIYYDTGDVLSNYEIDKRNGCKKQYKHKIDDDAFAVEYLETARADKCDTTLREYKEQLSEYGINVSLATLHRYFERNDITTKIITSVCLCDYEHVGVYQTMYCTTGRMIEHLIMYQISVDLACNLCFRYMIR